MSESISKVKMNHARNWRASAPAPWDSSNLYFFTLPAVELYIAAPVRLPHSVFEMMKETLCKFSHLVTYMGLRESTHRVSQALKMRDANVKNAQATDEVLWLKALLITHLVAKAVSELSSQMTLHTDTEYDEHCEKVDAEKLESKLKSDIQSEVEYPLSPLHLWVIHEAMDYLKEDMLPFFNQSPQSIPFPGIQPLNDYALAIQKMTAPMLEAFHEYHPYDYLADIETVLKDAEYLLAQAEDKIESI